MSYKAQLGYQGGIARSYQNESKEDFEARVYRIALFAQPGEIKIEHDGTIWERR